MQQSLPPLLAAKNGRARGYIDKILDLSGLVVEDMRAEDIPWLVDKELPQYLGLTTTEFVVDYMLGAKSSALETLKVISWEDNESLYGKPAICAIGKPNVAKEELQAISNRDIVVAVNGKFALLGAALAAGYIDRRNIAFKRFGGNTEAAIGFKSADLALEIVSSGKTATAPKVKGGYGLEIYAPLFFIDLALIANKNYLSQPRGG